MQEATILLTMLRKMSENGKTFDKLYPKLYNENLWLYAYGKIYSKQGNMTAGTDGKTADGMSKAKIRKLIDDLKTERYMPKPVKRVYIPKRNGGESALGIPSWEDKLLQTVMELIMSSIYEVKFQDTSHGFRPNLSCHTALEDVKRMNGSRWWIEGDIKGCFDNIDHETLLKIISKTIKDNRFLILIKKLLKSGTIDDWRYEDTYSGTPQGGNLSPLLSNIYLNELDENIREFSENFKRGKGRAKDEYWKKVLNRRYRAKQKAKQTGDWSKFRDLGKELVSIPAMKQDDKEFRRMYYVRYADDFIIGVNGSKADAKEIKSWLEQYLRDELNLELSKEKTLITNTKDRANFLGYEIKRWNTRHISRGSNRVKQRRSSYNIGLFIPRSKVNNFAKVYGTVQGWKGSSRTELYNNSEIEILLTYNAELRGFLNYYKIAHNFTEIGGNVRKMAYESLFKTIACKRNSSAAKVRKRMKVSPGTYQLTINVKGIERVYKLVKLDDIRNMKRVADKKPNRLKYYDRTEFVQRLNAEICEWCGSKGNIEVHHVRKISNLSGKQDWEK